MGCILEHQIFRFAKMILRDRCSTLYDLAWLFRARHSTLDRWSGKIARRIGTRRSALHSTFHSWRKSQNYFVFDIVKFKKWGSLAELLRFWCCHRWKWRKPRRIASFLMLSAWKIEEVSQNSFVFKLADRQIDRQLQLQLQLRYTTTTTTNTIYYATLHYTNYTILH